jgi:peptidoglycan/LPS O-acetylase OafA/YrhL
MPTLSPQTSRGEPRLAGVEWLRLIACLGIVAFHAQVPGGQIALGGLPAFTILTVALAIRSARGRRWLDFASARLRTLLAPWAFWSLFYAVISSYIAHTQGHPTLSWIQPSNFLIGGFIHLWFLPFALVATLLVGAFAVRGKSNDTGSPGPESGLAWLPWLILGVAMIPCATFALEHGPIQPPVLGETWPAPFEQYLSVIAGVPLGVSLALIPAGDRKGWGRLACFGALTIAVCATLILTSHNKIAIPDLIAVASCPIAWGLPARAGERTLRWSRLSYGVYLLHPFFALIGYKFIMPHLGSLGYAAAHWLHAGAIGAMSLVGTWVARKTPLVRVV